MSDKCEFCGEILVEGDCVNPDCDLSNLAPAISDRADLSEDTFLPDLDLDEDFVDDDEMLPEISSDQDGQEIQLEPTLESSSGPEMLMEPELSKEPGQFREDDVAATIDSVPELGTVMAPGPEVRDAQPEEYARDSDGPLLSLEQAAIPIDHTGTIIFEGVQGAFHTQAELRPDHDATRLTDDENYRIIRTVLHESTETESPKDIRTGRAKGELTGRPEVSMTIRTEDPVETHRTLDKLPSRDLSVPSDSASLERKKARQDDYDLDSKDYKIVDKVGEGGSGVVYKAKQIALKRTVALKVLKQRRMKSGTRSRTRTKELDKRKSRFLHEVHVTAKLQHPNIIPLYDLGMNSHGEVFYSMKLIDESSAAGDEVQQSWASLVRSQPTEGSESQIEKNVSIFSRVCDAMRYAHAEQIVHRDLKPDNVMVGQFGEVLVIDWGMALDLSQGLQPFTAGGTTSYMPPEMGLHYLKQSEIHKLSHKLMVALGEARRDVYVESVLDNGTRHAAEQLMGDGGVSDKARSYCEDLVRLDNEEQALAEQVNISSDIYLLGAILYEIAVGHPPHYVPQDSCKSIEEKHHREFWLSSNHRIQRLVQIKDPLRLSLCNIALKALQKDQADRYQSVDELKEAIQGFNKQVQSLKLVATGRESMQKAEGGEGYLHLLPALESFRGAQSLWPQGEDAKKFQTETACEYARRADARKDFDAGLSILDEYTNEETKQDNNVVNLVTKLERGKEIAARNRRLATIGWVAAVVLPIAVFLWSGWRTADLRSQAIAAKAEIQSVEKEAEAAQEKAEIAKQNADKAQAEADQAQADADNARQEVAKAEKEKDALAEDVKKKEAEVKKAEADVKQAEMDMLVLAEDVRQAEENVNLAKQRQVDAEKNVTVALKKVNQVRANSAKDKFKSLLLPIPLDIRKGKLAQARDRLEALRQEDLSPQFKNGWLARHFAKVVNVKGLEKKLGDNTTIIGLVHGSNDSLISVAYQNGKPGVWQMDAKSGETSRLEMQLPATGRIADVAISPDGKWLAFALDGLGEGSSYNEHFWVANLATGERAAVTVDSQAQPDAENGVIGCKLVGFGDSNSAERLQLITLEELSAYQGLKQRLQLATRDLIIQPQALEEDKLSTTAISATNRGADSVRSIAAMNQVNGRSVIAIVYQALDRQGRDKIVLEALTEDEEGKFSGNSVNFDQYPTVMHVGSMGQLFCGFADGRVSQYSVERLTPEPVRPPVNEHESPVTVLTSSPDGKVVTGSRNGVMIVLDNQMNFVKRLVGQPDALTTVSIRNLKGSQEFELASGGANGFIRVWNPNSTLHDAAIEKSQSSASSDTADGGTLRLGGTNEVSCGAIDRHTSSGAVPATAYGTKDGRVFYFNPADMDTGQGGQQISADAANQSRVSIAPPVATFDSAFSDFDSFGIVGDRFVLLQSDGQLFVTRIERDTDAPSAELKSIDATMGREVVPEFQPLLACQPKLTYFFTTDPANKNEILFWNDIGDSVSQPIKVQTDSTQAGRIKRLSLSPDGNWLAVVREVGRRNASGEYVTEVFETRPNQLDQSLRLASKTNRYRVGDPAFVGFSADSSEIVLHFHKLGVDRETWIEIWSLADGQWNQAEAKQKIDEDRRVDLIAWDGQSLMVTKSNRRFFLVDKTTDRTLEVRGAKSNKTNRNRLRNVRPTGMDGTQYVLFSESLERFDDSGVRDSEAEEIPFKNARDVRVFGEEAVVLDDVGFHLVNANLENITLIARRKISTKSLSLSNDRLAISYDIGGLCRIMDVSVKPPAEIGRFDNAGKVKISPDAKWAACQRNGELQIFDIRKPFEAPTVREKIATEQWAYQWLGSDNPNVLLATQADDGELTWSEVDPRAGKVGKANLKLPAAVGVTGKLVSFEVAPITQKYLALTTSGSASQFALWAISPDDEAVRLGQEQELSTAALNPISVSFSEINQNDINKIGTRMVILTDSMDALGARNSKATKVFLLSDDLLSQEDQALPEKRLYRAFEIENVIEVTDGRNLIDASFSGDGKSLLQVDERGVKVLLSQD